MVADDEQPTYTEGAGAEAFHEAAQEETQERLREEAKAAKAADKAPAEQEFHVVGRIEAHRLENTGLTDEQRKQLEKQEGR